MVLKTIYKKNWLFSGIVDSDLNLQFHFRSQRMPSGFKASKLKTKKDLFDRSILH